MPETIIQWDTLSHLKTDEDFRIYLEASAQRKTPVTAASFAPP